MLSLDLLKKVVHAKDDLSRTDQLLLCLAAGAGRPKSLAAIRETAVAVGLRGVLRSNVSGLLGASRQKAIRVADGWELGPKGKEAVRKLVERAGLKAGPLAASSLREHLDRIKDHDCQAFATEAIVCFESELYRAAAVLSWVGALALLYDHIVRHELAAFNAEALRRNAKWKTAKTRDDLALMPEFDFLQVLEAISVIGKSVKHELEACLKLRNGCGHPNSLKLAEHRVSSHIEVLILNVYAIFPK